MQEVNSKAETYKHILTVQEYINKVLVELIKRGHAHDQSKLQSPEVEIFEEHTPKLAKLEYDSPEYKQSLKDIKPALDHHYANNRHHPEYFNNGIKDMNLVDLLEMLVDWMAASKRQNNGNIRTSIDKNQIRFKYGDELKQILINTLPLLEQ